jgi:hypothetical protein
MPSNWRPCAFLARIRLWTVLRSLSQRSGIAGSIVPYVVGSISFLSPNCLERDEKKGDFFSMYDYDVKGLPVSKTCFDLTHLAPA